MPFGIAGLDATPTVPPKVTNTQVSRGASNTYGVNVVSTSVVFPDVRRVPERVN